mmetsp:Transcript_11018/g.26605  ORF Transcript_11018/g.26605 Transcript_11018/m.26605 type:complete len:206 (-) Transcript_11018:514-1131(-)
MPYTRSPPLVGVQLVAPVHALHDAEQLHARVRLLDGRAVHGHGAVEVDLGGRAELVHELVVEQERRRERDVRGVGVVEGHERLHGVLDEREAAVGDEHGLGIDAARAQERAHVGEELAQRGFLLDHLAQQLGVVGAARHHRDVERRRAVDVREQQRLGDLRLRVLAVAHVAQRRRRRRVDDDVRAVDEQRRADAERLERGARRVR